MKKIIFCDLDGTLLPAGKSKLAESTLSHIKRITDKGMLFCVASGRPYSDLKRIFGPLYRKIIFICLDGTLIMHRDCVLYKNTLKNIKTLLGGTQRATVFCRQSKIELPPERTLTDRLSEVNKNGGEAFKIALYGTPAENADARLCYSRDGIYEYVPRSADKGVAARVVLDKFRTDAQNAAALGDGDNDLALLRAVETPYTVTNCHPLLLDCGFPSVTTADEFLSKF